MEAEAELTTVPLPERIKSDSSSWIAGLFDPAAGTVI